MESSLPREGIVILDEMNDDERLSQICDTLAREKLHESLDKGKSVFLKKCHIDF